MDTHLEERCGEREKRRGTEKERGIEREGARQRDREKEREQEKGRANVCECAGVCVNVFVYACARLCVCLRHFDSRKPFLKIYIECIVGM